MDLELFWAIVSWALVIGGGVFAMAIGYYWFVTMPHQHVPVTRVRRGA